MRGFGGASRAGSSAYARRQSSVAVTIERLGHLGDGIGAGPVYVPRTLPGEVVDGAIVDGKIAAPRIVTPSPVRVSPPCRHYRGCGGCAMQHASDSFVAEWKVEVVRAALEARGLPAQIRRIHTSPPGARRRATFSGKRTGNGATVGFHAPASEIIREVPDCRLVRPAIAAALPALAALVETGGSRKGEMHLTVTETETGLDLSVTGGKTPEMETRQRLVSLVSDAGFARLTWDADTLFVEHAPVLTFGTAPVTPPPGGFLQATTEGEAVLTASVTEAISASKGAIVDLFSGIGTFALPLATCREVHAVEGDGEMLAALDRGWRHGKGLHRVTTERRDLFRRPLTADELGRFGAAVIDPPRAGAETQTAELARARVPHVAFVSCNPVTFARDAALLAKVGYKVDWIDVVDQFRWSAHIELAAHFSLD